MKMATYTDVKLKKKREQTIVKETGFKTIRINPDKEDFDIFDEIGMIQNLIFESTKKVTEQSTKKKLLMMQKN